MTIFNFGSINIDHVYQVDYFVRPEKHLIPIHISNIWVVRVPINQLHWLEQIVT